MHEYYTIDTDVTLSEKIDNESVVINLTNGCYFNFNQTATYIWELIGCSLSKEEIVRSYSSAFHLSTEDAETDISSVLTNLLENNLVSGTSSPPAPIDPALSEIPYIKPKIEKFDDMQEMLLLDPIHEVTEKGWPYKNDEK